MLHSFPIKSSILANIIMSRWKSTSKHDTAMYLNVDLRQRKIYGTQDLVFGEDDSGYC